MNQLLIISLVILNLKGIHFNLDMKKEAQCFFHRGQNLGPEMHMDYEIYGDPAGVKFTLVDMDTKDTLIEVRQHTEVHNLAQHKINQQHNFLACWFNSDSEEKSIHFYFNQQNIVAYLDHDDVSSHRKLLQDYHVEVHHIITNVTSQYIMEDFYADMLNQQQFKVKLSYALRAFILFFIIIVQSSIFLKLIDKKLSEVKDMVIGPN